MALQFGECPSFLVRGRLKSALQQTTAIGAWNPLSSRNRPAAVTPVSTTWCSYSGKGGLDTVRIESVLDAEARFHHSISAGRCASLTSIPFCLRVVNGSIADPCTRRCGLVGRHIVQNDVNLLLLATERDDILEEATNSPLSGGGANSPAGLVQGCFTGTIMSGSVRSRGTRPRHAGESGWDRVQAISA